MKTTNLFFGMVVLALGVFAHADVPSTHGMLIFGQDATYASHLPMYHQPHDYQFIFKAKLSGGRSPALPAYHAAKQAGHTLFTIEPDTMDFVPVMNGARKSFSAILYDGHFERGGQPLGRITVEVEKILFQKKLNPNELSPDHDRFEVFGQDGEYYAAHQVYGRPNFDQISRMKNAQKCEQDSTGAFNCEPFSGELLSEIPFIGRPLMVGETIGSYEKLDVESEIYLEKGDLSF